MSAPSLTSGIIFLGVFLGIFNIPIARASHGAHLLISEVQITGGAGKTTYDFVELYNPTGIPVDLNGLRLVKRTATGTTDTTIKSWIESSIIPAHGHYFWANNDFTDIGAVPDTKTSGTIADNNGLALRQGAENVGTIIDAVSWGTSANAFTEGVVFTQNPAAGQSMERKPGGVEGNGNDTHNNASDFVLQSAPNPQNVGSAPTPEIIPANDSNTSPVIGDITNFSGGANNNSTPTPAAFKGGEVLINEFVPDPETGLEWIEFYNTMNASVDLEKWKIADGTGDTIKSLAGVIASRSFFIAELTSSRLNNSGDRVMLKASDSTLIDAVSYGDWADGNLSDNAPAPTKSGQAVARRVNGADSSDDKNDFGLTETPTKGAANVISVSTIITVGGSSHTPEMNRSVPLPKIVINEFVSDPEDGPEWVELYNAGEVSVDLEGWYLEEGSEAKTKLSGTLVPEHFKVVRDISGNLNNSGDIIRLKNDKDQVVDRVSYGVWEDGIVSDNAPVARDANSVARRQDGKDTDNDHGDFAITSKVTKGKFNVVEDSSGVVVIKEAKVVEVAKSMDAPKTIAPSVPGGVLTSDLVGKLYITELLPDPADSDSNEWVELFWNGGSPQALEGFLLDDAEGGSSPFKLDGLIAASQKYLLLKRERTHLTLNNTADSVRILDGKGSTVDAIEYESSRQGQSYAKDKNGKWFWSVKATPGEENIIEIDAEEEAASAEDNNSRAKKSSATVKLVGEVTALSGMFGAQIMYVLISSSDAAALEEGAGIQVYSNKKQFPELKLGDRVEVEGVLGKNNGETRLKIKNEEGIQKVGHGKIPVARLLDPGELGEDEVGGLVKIAGAVIDAKRGGFTVDDGEREVYVQIKNGTGIEAREILPGTQVTVTGIVSQSTAGIKVLPRVQEDIEITGQESLGAGDSASARQGMRGGVNSVAVSSSPYAKATAATFGGSALLGLAIRRRKMFTSGFRALRFILRRGNPPDKMV